MCFGLEEIAPLNAGRHWYIYTMPRHYALIVWGSVNMVLLLWVAMRSTFAQQAARYRRVLAIPQTQPAATR
jgi:hypothetical protein